MIENLEDLTLSGRQGFVSYMIKANHRVQHLSLVADVTFLRTRGCRFHSSVVFPCLLLKVPSRYTVPLREGIDFHDLVQGDGTMFETDLDNMGEKK